MNRPTTHTDSDTPDTGGLFVLPEQASQCTPARARRGTRPSLRAVPCPNPAGAVNDLDRIEGVLRLAQEPGYVLIGSADGVWRRHGPREIERVGADEALVVRQLLAHGFLVRGTDQRVTQNRYETTARALRVSSDAAALLRRLRLYRRSASTQAEEAPLA